ncbi:alpha/beta hydrolase [Kitasatospora sp. CM 4170]|uniref:Alpha/beta hydrolase n=1 Tax=Kitasatospora aburaviensis TaxID=67265 RepID=A0ABW1EV12_9ACTN|nr:alpha/beta hydrolase [Kitasatospora sp. CM 4170]WNM43637.1 alpha/beta hydrolase [Kitasatospora sp. CM 4170]
MSEDVYWNKLRSADVSHLHAAADRWESVAQKLTHHAADWRVKTHQRVLNSGWTGDAAAAAEAQLGVLESQLKNCQQEIESIRLRFRDAADDLLLLKADQAALKHDCEAQGFWLYEPDGRLPQVRIKMEDEASGSPGMVGNDPEFQRQLSALKAKRPEIEQKIKDFDERIRNFDELWAGSINHLADVGQKDTVDEQTAADDLLHSQWNSVIPADIQDNKDPKASADWWNSLPESTRQQLLKDFPGVIGNTDGIPAQDRDAANRLYLPQLRDQMATQLAGGQPDPGVTQTKLDGLNALQKQLDAPSNPPMMLLGVGGRGPIVSYGNPDQATNIASYVPSKGGLDETFVNGDLGYGRQLAVAAHQADPKTSTATVVWMNYDAPPRVAGTSISMTGGSGGGDDGSQPFSQFQNGLKVTHDGRQPNLTAIGTGYHNGTLMGATQGTNWSGNTVVTGDSGWSEDMDVKNVALRTAGDADLSDPATLKATANVVTGHGDRNKPMAPR